MYGFGNWKHLFFLFWKKEISNTRRLRKNSELQMRIELTTLRAGSSSDVGEKAAGPKKLGLYRQTARWKSSMFHESNYNVSPALYAVINNNQPGNCRMILWKQKKEKWSWTWGKKCNFVHIVISSWKRNDNASIEASFVWRLLESPLSNSIYIEINQFSVLLNKYDSIEFCQKGLFLCCSQCRVCFSTQSQAGLKATVEKWLAF